MNKNFWKTKTIKSYFKIYIKTLPVSLSCILIICIVFIILYIFLLVDIKEIFPKASIVGNVVYNLAFAYLASFIFYFLTIHIKEQRDKTKINTFVGDKIKKIIDNTKEFVNIAANHIKYIQKDAYPSEEELKYILSKININDKTDISYFSAKGISNYTFREYMCCVILKNNELIKSIYIKMQFLDSDVVSILSKIEDSTFSRGIQHFAQTQYINNPFEGFTTLYYLYMQPIKELEEYYNSKIKFYIKE